MRNGRASTTKRWPLSWNSTESATNASCVLTFSKNRKGFSAESVLCGLSFLQRHKCYHGFHLTGALPSNTFNPVLTFVETMTFTGQITDLVSDDDYAVFQTQLSLRPDKGSLLAGCGGVRKVRMAAKGKGTSGGARILYLHLPNRQLIYFLYLFTKGKAENISAEGKKAIRQIAEQIKLEHRQ